MAIISYVYTLYIHIPIKRRMIQVNVNVGSNPYKVQQGQTLGGIALEMKKKDPSLKNIPLWGDDGLVARLQKQNGMKDGGKLAIGQELNMDTNSILGNSFGSKATGQREKAPEMLKSKPAGLVVANTQPELGLKPFLGVTKNGPEKKELSKEQKMEILLDRKYVGAVTPQSIEYKKGESQEIFEKKRELQRNPMELQYEDELMLEKLNLRKIENPDADISEQRGVIDEKKLLEMKPEDPNFQRLSADEKKRFGEIKGFIVKTDEIMNGKTPITGQNPATEGNSANIETPSEPNKKPNFLQRLIGRKEPARESKQLSNQPANEPVKKEEIQKTNNKGIQTTDEMIAQAPNTQGSHGERKLEGQGVKGSYEIIGTENGYQVKQNASVSLFQNPKLSNLLTGYSSMKQDKKTGEYITRTGAKSKDFNVANRMAQAGAQNMMLNNAVYGDLQGKKSSGALSKAELGFMQNFEKQLQQSKLKRDEQGQIIE